MAWSVCAWKDHSGTQREDESGVSSRGWESCVVVIPAWPDGILTGGGVVGMEPGDGRTSGRRHHQQGLGCLLWEDPRGTPS